MVTNLYKKITLLSAATCGVCGLAFGQSTAYTAPVGYTTTTINQGFNPTAITLHAPALVSGSLEIVQGNVLTDSDITDFATILPAGRTYIIEITGGTGAGATQDFITVTGSTMTMPASIGVDVGSQYKVRVAPTLEEIFGTTTTILKKNNNGANADNVYVPDGLGGYIRYFINASSVWRRVSPAGAAPNTPIMYLDGIFVERKDAGSVSLVITGEVKTTPTISSINQGFNLIGTVYPAGATLQNFGFEDDVLKNNNGANADNIYIPNGLGGYARYFLNASNVWRIVSPAGPAPANVSLTPGLFFERKAAGTVAVDFNVPF